MKRTKQDKLKANGWKVSDTKEFLGLSDEELSVIETKRSLIQMLRETRVANEVTQAELAGMLSSSQSRIAKMEAASPDVSLDLILRALFTLGVSRKKVGRAIAG